MFIPDSRVVTLSMRLKKITSFFETVEKKASDLVNIFTGSQSWNRQHYDQTIHPTEKLTSMNLFKIFCVVKWA